MSLDRNHPNTGYQLGRLFAVYELAQRAALGRGVSDDSRQIFRRSLHHAREHLPHHHQQRSEPSLQVRREKPGWASVIEKELEEVVGRIQPVMPFSLPRSLRLEDQGEFAIGYYHQRKARLGDGTAEQPTLDGDNNEGDDIDD